MDKNTPSFNLNVVVRETGIKPDTLRAWERRYGLPDPDRTEGGHRLYSSRDIEMIRWLMARQNEGMRISQAVQMWKDLTAEGADPLNPAQAEAVISSIPADLPADSALAQLRQAWIESCLVFNEAAADQVFSQALARYPVQVASVEILQKGLRAIGDKWYQSGVTVQQEHFASALAIKRLNALISAAPSPTRPEKIMVGCPPGEEHIFSPLMVELILRYSGYEVTYLGANVPLENLEKTTDQVNPNLVIYTAMHLDSAAALLMASRQLAEKRVPFAFGGRIFQVQPELQKRIPGYFLGERLDQVAEFTARVFSGVLEPNQAFDLAQEYQQALDQFDRIRLALELNIYRHYADEDFPVHYLQIINQHFNQFVRAALMLGNLDYLESEISWSETLIANNLIPSELVQDFLKVYRQLLFDLGGEKLSLVTGWLEERIAGQ